MKGRDAGSSPVLRHVKENELSRDDLVAKAMTEGFPDLVGKGRFVSLPCACHNGNLVSMPRDVLESLVAIAEAVWEDHSYAKTEDNPGWLKDKLTIEIARSCLNTKKKA